MTRQEQMKRHERMFNSLRIRKKSHPLYGEERLWAKEQLEKLEEELVILKEACEIDSATASGAKKVGDKKGRL